MAPFQSLARLILFSSLTLCHPLSDGSSSGPSVADSQVTYNGRVANDVESFLNIRFAHETSGQRRFAHPVPFQYAAGTTVDASAPGASCPQGKVPVAGFSVFDNVTDISEDCLTLRIDRPAGTSAKDKLPVFLWIYGGGDAVGQIYDQAYDPTGLVQNSVARDTPIIFVAMNYRVGIFGFAATPAQNASGNTNCGLYDQRLAMTWVQGHIHSFGGDPDRVTIAGESDGAEAVGLHILAFGGGPDIKAPFHQAIMESGAATEDAGVHSNMTAMHTANVIDLLNCTSSTADSKAELACLRALTYQAILATAIPYAQETAGFGFGVFDPVSPTPFIPDAPSKLLRQGDFARDINLIAGWNENDGTLFVPTNLTSDADTVAWLQFEYPHLSSKRAQDIIDLYPASAYSADPAANVTARFFAAAQMFRDQEFGCPSLLLIQNMAKYSTHKPSMYQFVLNASVFSTFFQQNNVEYYGVCHFSDLPFVMNQVTPQSGAAAALTRISNQMSGAWAAFTTHGDPSRGPPEMTLNGWDQTDRYGQDGTGPYLLRVIGGPRDGEVLTGDEPKHGIPLYAEGLEERCALWNAPDTTEQLDI